MKGYTYPGSPMKDVDPPSDKVNTTSDKDELVKHTYLAGSTAARGEGWEGTSDRDVYISKGTKRLIEAGAPKEIIEKSKLRDIELFKEQQN